MQESSSRYLASEAERSAVTRRAGNAKTRVLVVEDEQDIADLIKHTLERDGEIDGGGRRLAAMPR